MTRVCGGRQLSLPVAADFSDRRYQAPPSTILQFKNQKHGTTSQPQTVTLTNEGKTALKITSIRTSPFFAATTSCGKTLMTKASCKITVTFTPTAAGTFSGTVQISDSASSKPQVIAVSGQAH